MPQIEVTYEQQLAWHSDEAIAKPRVQHAYDVFYRGDPTKFTRKNHPKMVGPTWDYEARQHRRTMATSHREAVILDAQNSMHSDGTQYVVVGYSSVATGQNYGRETPSAYVFQIDRAQPGEGWDFTVPGNRYVPTTRFKVTEV